MTDNQDTAGATTADGEAVGAARTVAETAAGPGEILTVAQVGRELNVPRSWVYGLIRSGELTAVRVGEHTPWWVLRVDLEGFIAEAYQRTAEILHDLPVDPPAAFGAHSRSGADQFRTRVPRRPRRHPDGAGRAEHRGVMSVVHTRAS